MEKTLKKYSRQGPNGTEKHVLANYLEVLLELPWNRMDHRQENSIEQSQKVLDQNHFGLKEVKQRIVEFLAVRQMRGKDQK